MDVDPERSEVRIIIPSGGDDTTTLSYREFCAKPLCPVHLGSFGGDV